MEMSIQYDIQILRSKLISMTRLTQRTVDYAIKAMQLGRPELCRVVHNSKDEMSAIRCWIATHGGKLLETRIPGDAKSRFACAGLRISGALEVAYNAAIEIVQQIETRFATGWIPVSAELEDAGQFVNSLLRLCVLSLLSRDVRHAKAVLNNAGAGHDLDLSVYLTHHHLAQRTKAQVRFELAIIQCLEGIAGQTCEIADSIILWLEKPGRENVTSGSAQHKPGHQTVRLGRGTCTVVTVTATGSPSKAMVSSGAIPPLPALRLKPSDDCCIPSRGIAEAVSTEDFKQARLMGLQQRVCELLVKNQQLRMALMAEKADTDQDYLY
jgi:phosphate transport system protein